MTLKEYMTLKEIFPMTIFSVKLMHPFILCPFSRNEPTNFRVSHDRAQRSGNIIRPKGAEFYTLRELHYMCEMRHYGYQVWPLFLFLSASSS